MKGRIRRWLACPWRLRIAPRLALHLDTGRHGACAHGLSWGAADLAVLGVRWCRLGVHAPTTGWRLWIYWKQRARYIDLVCDRRTL